MRFGIWMARWQLTAVSHDLRSPFAAAAAVISCLRSPDLQRSVFPRPADLEEIIECSLGGPGVSEADRDKMFAPFQRLGDTDSTTGVGLGLAVSRGLTEAMRGTLQPAHTPGGGLTMTMSLPAAPRATRAHLPGCRPQGTGS